MSSMVSSFLAKIQMNNHHNGYYGRSKKHTHMVNRSMEFMLLMQTSSLLEAAFQELVPFVTLPRSVKITTTTKKQLDLPPSFSFVFRAFRLLKERNDRLFAWWSALNILGRSHILGSSCGAKISQYTRTCTFSKKAIAKQPSQARSNLNTWSRRAPFGRLDGLGPTLDATKWKNALRSAASREP